MIITASFLFISENGNAMKSLFRLLAKDDEQAQKQTQGKKAPLENEDKQKKKQTEVSFVIKDRSKALVSPENYVVYGVDQIFPSYWAYAHQNLRYDSLTHLTIKSSPEPSTEMVEFLEREAPHLVFLSFIDCPNLTVFGKRGHFDKSVYWVNSYAVHIPHLTDLVLIDNEMLSEVRLIADNLLEAILPNKGLRYLSLSSSSVRSINVEGTPITDDVLDAIVVSCPSLDKMSCKSKARQYLPMLTKKTRRLMDAKTVSTIGKKREKKEPIDLTISYNDIDLQMTKEVARIPFLTRLKLYNVQIGDDAVSILLTHKTLRSLYVMSDQLVKVVGETSYLKSYLLEAPLPIEAPSLQELWLVKCPQLTDVNLVGNKLNTVYATDNSLLSNFRLASSSVRFIDLSRSGVTTGSYKNLEKTCENVSQIHVEECPNLFAAPSFLNNGSSDTDQGPTDHVIDIGNLELTSKQLTPKKASKIAGMKGISSLILHFYEIFPNSFYKLSKLTTLRLYACKFDPELLTEIWKMSNLREFLVWDTFIGSQGANDVVKTPHLQLVNLRNTQIGEEGAQHIIDVLRKQKTLFVILDDSTVSAENSRKISILNKLNSNPDEEL